MADHRRSRFAGEGKPRLLNMQDSLSSQGLAVDPVPMTAGEEVTVLYQGLLANSGADQVWLHTGYGTDDNWRQIYDYPMERTARGWVKVFKLQDESRLHFCFKDSASNWDNNNGTNWSFEIHNGARI